MLDRLASGLADRYRLERELGQGGMATVYLAEDLKHDRKVAIKVLKPELAAVLGAERFVQEIKTTAALSHPHILPLFDSGTVEVASDSQDSRPTIHLYYVMPYIQGETIREKLDRETQLGIDEAVKIATEVADALHYAHRHGVIHRDIKPENILLHDGRPMVMDFGIALAVSAAAGGRMTETGLSLGSPHYMSPEQATAEKEISARSDVYSLGTVLYEMLSGQPPHVGGSAQQIIMKIIAEEPAAVTQYRKSVPPNVAAAVAKALEKLPADRFESAKAFAEALAHPTFTHGSVTVVRGSRASAARYRDPAFVALALLTLTSLAVAAWAMRDDPTPRTVARYSIRLPEGMQAAGAFARFTLTPDGGKVFFTAGVEGERALWFRDRDELEATRIPGTFRAYAPFVSPEGDQIGFLSDYGGIHIASLDGSVPRSVGDSVTFPAGATWGPDGMIYLGFARDPLSRVDASGRAPAESFTTLDAVAGEGAHSFPDALPNGKGVLFTISRIDKGEEFQEIGVARTADGSHTALVRGVYARYAASGHLLYVTADGTLMAAPFDQERLALVGPGATVVTNLTLRIGDVPDLAVSRNGTLLYSTGGPTWWAGGRAVWVRRDGEETEVGSSWAQSVEHVALSPDATRLAVTINRATNTSDVWVRELAGGGMSRLTTEGRSGRPIWTPDGQDLLFVGNRNEEGGVSRAGVFRQEVGSRNARLVFGNPPWLVQEVLLSPDTQWLIYRTGLGAGTEDIHARRLTGDTASIALAATVFREMGPTLSPDGRWLAFISNETGADEVYVQSFPDPGGRRWPVSTGGGSEPLWSRDGQELFYRNGRNEMVAVAVTHTSTPPLGRQQVLFSTRPYAVGSNSRMYDVTPDRQRFVMMRLAPGQSAEDFRLVVVENFFEELKRLAPR